jgi:hypothetical protein
VALILPHAAYDDNRWRPLFENLQGGFSVPDRVNIYQQQLRSSNELWADTITLEQRPSGEWKLWMVAVDAGDKERASSSSQRKSTAAFYAATATGGRKPT